MVGTDGQPVSGAYVFNRGDGAELVATVTDSQGQFQLGSLLPGTKYAFIHKEGYRFTGSWQTTHAGRIADHDARASEPPPEWKPVSHASFDEQRTFAKRILTGCGLSLAGISTAYGRSSASAAMAPIDLQLAAGVVGGDAATEYDSVLHQTVAEKMAEHRRRKAF